MDSSTTYVAQKDDFDVTLSKTDCELAIEAEDQGTGQTYSAKFSNDSIKSMTHDIFESVPEFFEGLLTAFEEISEDTSVTVKKEGKLLFTQKLKIGKHEKVFSFSIPLKIVEVDPINRLEKQVKKLFREVETVKKENQKLRERLGPDYEIIKPEFSTSSTYSSQFKISHDKKTITKQGQNNNNNAYHGYESTMYNNNNHAIPLGSVKKLSKETNSKFEVKIENLSGNIAIGVGISDVMKAPNCIGISESYCLYSPNSCCENGSSKSFTNYSNLTKGSTVGVLYLPSKEEILFDINGTHIYTVKIDQAHKNADLYPFVGATHPGDKLSFV